MSAAIMCRYYGPIDKATGTGAYVTYNLYAVDEKTGKESPVLPGSGPPPHKVVWHPVELRYEVTNELSNGNSVTIRLPLMSNESIPGLPPLDTETHDIVCAGTTDNFHALAVETLQYVDDKNAACSDDNPAWHDDFAALLPRLRPKLTQHTSGKPGKWKSTKSTSSFDDSETVVLSLAAENQIQAWPGSTSTPTLALRCKEGRFEAYIAAGMQGKLEFGQHGQDIGVSMRGRYDQGETNRYLMSKSTDGRTFFFSNPNIEIVKMLVHSTLVLEFTPFNSNPVEMRFDLSGLSAVADNLHTCGW